MIMPSATVTLLFPDPTAKNCKGFATWWTTSRVAAPRPSSFVAFKCHILEFQMYPRVFSDGFFSFFGRNFVDVSGWELKNQVHFPGPGDCGGILDLGKDAVEVLCH